LLAVPYSIPPASLFYFVRHNDSRGGNGTSQSTPPNLVNTGHKSITLCGKVSFFGKRGYLVTIQQPYPLYPLPFDKGEGEDIKKRGFTPLYILYAFLESNSLIFCQIISAISSLDWVASTTSQRCGSAAASLR